MTITQHDLNDLSLVIKRSDDGIITMQISNLNSIQTRTLSSAISKKWLALQPGEVIPRLQDALDVNQDESVLFRFLNEATAEDVLNRITLEIDDLQLASLSWERSLMRPVRTEKNTLSKYIEKNVSKIVRVSRVLPRVISFPLTLPIRMLEVNSDPEMFRLSRIVQDIFPERPLDQLTKGIQVARCSFDEISAWQEKSGWPTAEVLQFDDYPLKQDADSLLSTADPESSCTLGWLTRLADNWQTRLIIFHCWSREAVGKANMLATALTNRGGPTVLVGDFSDLDSISNTYQQFWENLFQDKPIELSARSPNLILFLGAGRSGLLQFSAPVATLDRLVESLPSMSKNPLSPTMRGVNALIQRIKELPSKTISLQHQPGYAEDPSRARKFINRVILQQEIRRTLHRAKILQSEEPGGSSILFLSDTLYKLRDRIGVHRPTNIEDALKSQRMGNTPLSRFVNFHFCRSDHSGQLTQLSQVSAPLTVGDEYHLTIQIGPKDEAIITVGNMALIEEVIKWTERAQGVWLEIGLTGLDFDVIGDPVQEIWLPRSKAVPTDPVYFTVIPRKEGVSRIRICIYQKQDIIQSWRLASLTTISQMEQTLPYDQERERLAKALDLEVKKVPSVVYLARQEYSTSKDLVLSPDRQERTLSIVANHLDDKSVITIKGRDHYDVHTNNLIPTYVSNVRNALDRISTDRRGSKNSTDWRYRFDPGYGDLLKEALIELATHGWILFSELIRNQFRKQLRKDLEMERRIIQVAHILVEHVIPWAMIYDRYFDSGRKVDSQGRAIKHDACLAALPDRDGNLPVTKCGEHPNCPLSKIVDEDLRNETAEIIACPLHFWGFKHIIEIPPQQKTPGKKGRDQSHCIKPTGTVRMTAAFNQTLPLADTHFTKLERVVQELSINGLWTKYTMRDAIVSHLKATSPDVIYFYCHANDKDEAMGHNYPYLEFQESQKDMPQYILASDLSDGIIWKNAPLVILNGCRTVGFTPHALSPFIMHLVQDRGAAGLLGTEIYVWETLADEMALQFLNRFLGEVQAGEALLLARRSLLSQYNPLGLVYTLYADAELGVDFDGDGHCKNNRS